MFPSLRLPHLRLPIPPMGKVDEPGKDVGKNCVIDGEVTVAGQPPSPRQPKHLETPSACPTILTQVCTAYPPPGAPPVLVSPDVIASSPSALHATPQMSNSTFPPTPHQLVDIGGLDFCSHLCVCPMSAYLSRRRARSTNRARASARTA